MSTTSSVPAVSGPVKEAAGYAKEEMGEKLGDMAMALEGRDLRNRGRLEQGKDVLVGTPGMGNSHPASQTVILKEAKEVGFRHTMKTVAPPLLNDVRSFDKSRLGHIETVDKSNIGLTVGRLTTKKPTGPKLNLNSKECHLAKGDAELMLAKDSSLPLTERAEHAAMGLVEKAKSLFSSGASQPTTSAPPVSTIKTSSLSSSSAIQPGSSDMNIKEVHQQKSEAEINIANDSSLPFTERLKHAATGIAEQAKAIFAPSSSSSMSTSATGSQASTKLASSGISQSTLSTTIVPTPPADAPPLTAPGSSVTRDKCVYQEGHTDKAVMGQQPSTTTTFEKTTTTTTQKTMPMVSNSVPIATQPTISNTTGSTYPFAK